MTQFAEIPEAEASGSIAALYDDIRATAGTAMVNLIYRHLATIPDALPWAWDTIRHAIGYDGIVAGADRLPTVGLGAPLPEAAYEALGLDGRTVTDALRVVERYNHANALNIVTLTALLDIIGRAPDGVGAPPSPPRATPATAGGEAAIPPIVAFDAMDAGTLAIVMRLARIGAAAPEAEGIVPSLYRHIANWPCLRRIRARRSRPARRCRRGRRGAGAGRHRRTGGGEAAGRRCDRPRCRDGPGGCRAGDVDRARPLHTEPHPDHAPRGRDARDAGAAGAAAGREPHTVMIVPLWAIVTVGAAAAQTARNATQRHLTATLGTLGATLVRFLYGLPFAVLFLVAVVAVTGEVVPAPTLPFVGLVVLASVGQIAGTALMLAAMRITSFSVTVAYTKTEPIQVALFGFVWLGERLSATSVGGIVAATIGVVMISHVAGSALLRGLVSRPALLGLASAAAFALAAVGFKAAILEISQQPRLIHATTTLVWSLSVQSLLLVGYLLARQPSVVLATIKAWRQSLFAGFMGALASQCWFFGFSLTSAANVRTLGLVEVLFAQLVSRRVAETVTPRQLAGMALMIAGVAALFLGH